MLVKQGRLQLTMRTEDWIAKGYFVDLLIDAVQSKFKKKRLSQEAATGFG